MAGRGYVVSNRGCKFPTCRIQFPYQQDGILLPRLDQGPNTTATVGPEPQHDGHGWTRAPTRWPRLGQGTNTRKSCYEGSIYLPSSIKRVSSYICNRTNRCGGSRHGWRSSATRSWPRGCRCRSGSSHRRPRLQPPSRSLARIAPVPFPAWTKPVVAPRRISASPGAAATRRPRRWPGRGPTRWSPLCSSRSNTV